MKFSILFTVLFAFLFISNSRAQEKFTVSGYVKDAADGETLIGATVFVNSISTGTVTNTYGFYSLTLPAGQHTIEYRYISYGTIIENVELTSNLRIDIELAEEVQQMQEIVVVAERLDQNVTSTDMSVNKLDIKLIQKIPAFLGEVDVIKSIQLLPGVSTVGEGASGFNVRGGSVGQNLVLLDDAPVYNSSHLLGFFSVFNPDAVKDVKLYKGAIPARYGGRISSILDIQMREGNMKKPAVQGGVGTIFSRLTVEAPIIKDKASFILAGRRSYADVLARPFTDVLDDGAALNFYDLTAKANYNINQRNRIYLSGYWGRDNFLFDENQGFSWGNRTGTLRWNHLFNDRLFFNLTSVFSDYTYELAFGDNDQDKFEWDSRIRTTTLKPEFTYFVNSNNEVSFGGELTYYRFDPANAVGISAGEISDISIDTKYSYEMAAYISNSQTISKKISLDYGLRFSSFMYVGPGKVYEFEEINPGERDIVTSVRDVKNGEIISDYYFVEPRLAMKYQLSPSSSLKASYNFTTQYVHLISNTTASNPLDVWTPSTNNIKPQTGNQYVLGFFKNLRNNEFETSAEVYYRTTENQIEYIDGADLLINELLEADLESGIGRAYGLELFVKKNTGLFTGWVSYTLGRTELKVDGINRGEWYPTRFDQTHNLSITTNYELNDRWSLSANFSFITGTPTTFPTSRYEIQDYVVPVNASDSRNNIRIDNYHRLDLSATWLGRKYKKGQERKNEDYWVFGVYNAYGRENPFSVYFSQGTERPLPDVPIPTKGTKVAIIGYLIPAISYNFKF